MTLRLSQITKRFGSLVANDAIDLEIRPGEIHCLLGENGAGKSTLMNVLYGLLQPDAGTISVDGREVTFANPREAMAAGIGMVHQHFMLVDPFTVTENLLLGESPKGVAPIRRSRARARVRELSERYRLDVDPDARVEDLPVGVQQRVEILKALAHDATYLVLDEPTAVLTPQEIEELMVVLRALRAEGKAIVFITHKLAEVRAVADRITVIRRGRVVAEADPSASTNELAELMVGRAVSLTVAKDAPRSGDVRLRVRDLDVVSDQGATVVDRVSFDVRGGEILGIAGVQGNGQSELADALLGVLAPSGGSIELDGESLAGRSVRQRIRAGLGFVPEDRTHDGFVADYSVADNLVLNTYADEWSTGPVLRRAAIDARAEELVERFDVRTESIETPVGALSGGNAQKVILARELSRPLKLLVASQPTRGVDVGAIEFLHECIVAERDTGTAVVIVSTELDEIAALADRVIVLYRGRVVGEVGPDASRETVGAMMAGVPPQAEREKA